MLGTRVLCGSSTSKQSIDRCTRDWSLHLGVEGRLDRTGCLSRAACVLQMAVVASVTQDLHVA
jgi:hypothetical protein